MATVARNSNIVILYDILLDDCLSDVASSALAKGKLVYICLGKETVVSWDMRSDLGCANCQLMDLVRVGS